jgi:hypothetical protein
MSLTRHRSCSTLGEMNKIIIFIAIFALAGCQSYRVAAIKVENENGIPASGAAVGMYSMQSGHLLYPDVVTNENGIAQADTLSSINNSFILNVHFKGEAYSYAAEDFKFEGDDVLVLRLTDKQSKTINPNQSGYGQ